MGHAHWQSWFVVLVPSLFGVSCAREAPEGATEASAQPKSAAVSQPRASGAAPAASISPVALKEAPPPRGNPGEWIDAKLYRLRVGRVLRCEDATAKGGAAVRLGIEVEVASRADNVFVAPRDVALAREGVLVESLHLPQVPEACRPLFQPTTLQEGKSTSGVVIFDAPDLEFARNALLTYRPTRWGGAPPAEVKLPACLDACAGQN